MRVEGNSTRGRFDVTADGRGLTGRAGTGLLAEVADTLGLTEALEAAVNGCRSWIEHAPGKVVRDLVLVLADGGDTLRRLKTLGGDDQRVLFGAVASPATANRTVVALGDDELVVERLAPARKAARRQAWRTGGAPPVVAAALAGQRPDEPLCIDIDDTLVTAQSDEGHQTVHFTEQGDLMDSIFQLVAQTIDQVEDLVNRLTEQ